MIIFLFKDKFIQTWDNDLKNNNKFVPRWPSNSTDLWVKCKDKRLNKKLLRKIKNNIKWGLKKQEIYNIRVSYNDKFFLKLNKISY